MATVGRVFLASRGRRLWALAFFGCFSLVTLYFLATLISPAWRRNGGGAHHITSSIGFSYISGNNFRALTKLSRDDAILTADMFHRNLLMFACSLGNYRAAKILLKKGSLVDKVDNDNNTALLYAVRADNSQKLVALLLKMGANPNAMNIHGQTPLMFNSVRGSVAVADLLVSHGALVDVASLQGYTPLMLALEHGRVDVANELLDKHHASADLVNNRGQNAIMTAVLYAHPQVAVKLVGMTKNLLARDKRGMNVLHMAIGGGMALVVDALLSACPRLLDEDFGGVYPAGMAASVSRHMAMIVNRYDKAYRALPAISGSKAFFMNEAINRTA